MSTTGAKAKWPVGQLGDLCEISIGRTPARNQRDYWGPGSPWLSIADMNQGRDLDATAETITDVAVRECNCRLVPAGTVLLSFKLSIGKVGITKRPLFTNEAIAALPIKDACKLLPEFLYWSLRSIDLTLGLDRAAKGLTLNSDKLHRVRIPLPPLPEQRRIAEILDKADALRAKRRAALAQLDTLTQSIFLDMFGDPATNPKGWEVRSVGGVAEVQGGLQVTGARKGLPREVPYLRVANVYRDALDLREIKTIRATDAELARTSLVKDDLLIVEGHGNPQEIGRGALWDGSIPVCVHQNHIIRVRFDSERTVPRYACTYLNSQVGRAHLLRSGKTTSGLNTINVSEVRSTPIAVPPIELQREFARRVGVMQKVNAAQAFSVRVLDALFSALQHRAFRGEL